MPEIYFSQNTILYLPQIIMTTVWVLALARIPNPQTETRLLTIGGVIYLLCMFMNFLLMATIRPTPWHILSLFGSHLGALLSMVPALQWAYHIPTVENRYRREARYVLWASILAVLIISGTIGLYFQSAEPGVLDLYSLLFILFINVETFWHTCVLCRSAVRLSFLDDSAAPRDADAAKRSPWRRWQWPANRQARYAWGFAFASLFMFLAAFSMIFGSMGLNILKRTNLLAPTFLGAYSVLFGIIYVNYRAQLLTLMRKLTLLSLLVLLMLLGLAGYLIFPIVEKGYEVQPPVSAQERIRFSPNAQEGYDVAQIAYQFEDDLGAKTPMGATTEGPATLELIFPFRFYGQEWKSANIYAQGLIVFGEPTVGTPFVGHLHPAIAPWLASLAPGSGQVFVNQEMDRITITWQRMVDPKIGEPNTFQVLLYPSGAIDFVYQELQSTLYANSEISQGLWLIGLLPGNGSTINDSFHFEGNLPYSGQSGQAIVENAHHRFRAHVDQFMRPLAMLIIVSALIILIGFPLCFRLFLARPLNALTTGVRAVNEGDLQVRIPQYFNDELGFLTQSFNGMVDSIRSSRDELQHLNITLEQRIEERTQQLAAARDAAEAANRAKSSFLANMSHELRTPLNAVLGYAQLLQNRSTSREKERVGLETIYESGQHLLTLIDNVLDLAKIEAGKVDYQPARLHLPALLQSISKIVQFQAQAKSLFYSYRADDQLPDYIWGDERLLRQVLLNLLGNAIKFTPRGRVTLFVQRIDNERGPALRFSVIDAGIGIAPTELSKIFLPFEQAQNSSNQAGGAGLGLTISQRLLAVMESSLHVKSAVGQGSTFWFDLDLPEESAAMLAPEPSSRDWFAQQLMGYDGPRQKVLVADDNLVNRQVLRDMLTTVGFEVLLASDGLEAYETALAHQPCLILMDLVMTGMNGIEASKAIRKAQEPQSDGSGAFPKTVIIAVSASALAADQERSLAAGCNAFLPKPVDWRQLSTLLTHHLDLSWRYAEIDERPQPAPAATMSVGTSNLLQELHSAARMGDMREVIKLSAELARADIDDAAWLTEVTALAGNYQEKAVLNLVETHLHYFRAEAESAQS